MERIDIFYSIEYYLFISSVISLSKILSFFTQYTFLIILSLDILFLNIMSSMLFFLSQMLGIPGKTVIIIYHLSTVGSLIFSIPMRVFFFISTHLFQSPLYIHLMSTLSALKLQYNYWHINIIKDESIRWLHILFVQQSFPGDCRQCGRPGFSPWVGKIPRRRK